MDELIERAVERAIGYMRQNLGEQITIDDIAQSAMFSKFYFTRFFQRVTGMSPGRFLSALRLEKAKDLLLSTELTVTEVSYQVGYNSIGTFSSRFNESVGLTPTGYRQHGGRLRCLPGEAGTGVVDDRSATVCGRLRSAELPQAGALFVGLFATRLPQGEPARWTLLAEPGHVLLDGVPPGRWYLYAELAGYGGDGRHQVVVHGPVSVHREYDVRLPDLWLRPSTVFDPPMLLARLDEHVTAARLRTSGVADQRFAA